MLHRPKPRVLRNVTGVALCLLIGCEGGQESKSPVPVDSSIVLDDPAIVFDLERRLTDERPGVSFEYERYPPPRLLELLGEAGDGTVVLPTAPDGWLQREHVSALLSHAESDRPSAAVFDVRSSEQARGPSTVGREALYLVLGYRYGRYPVSLQSDEVDHLGITVEELSEWWRAGGRVEPWENYLRRIHGK